MIISSRLLKDAARVIARRVYGQDEADDQDREIARLVLLDVAPVIADAERERIASHIDPRKLELIAAWFELEDRPVPPRATPWRPWVVPEAAPGPEHPVPPNEVSRELRQWAALLRGGETPPEMVSGVLIDVAEAVEAVPSP